MSPVPQFLKRLEARIALALAEARSALLGIASLSNHSATSNAGAVGPGATLNFAAPSFTPKSGKVLILMVSALNSGTATNVQEILIFRDGVAIVGAPVINGADFLAGSLSGILVNAWIDSVAANTAHIWSMQILSPGSAGMEIPVNGAVIILIELPG